MKSIICYVFLIISMITSWSCQDNAKKSNTVEKSITIETTIIDTVPKKINYLKLFKDKPEYISDGFDFPVGKPNANGYYNAQKFKDNNHLGDDWNGVGGGNSDLGDNIYAISKGYVKRSENIFAGWGNIIRIVHNFEGNLYESIYAHCDTLLVKEGDFVNKGQLIGKIGNVDGLYYAHLHLEIRDSIHMGIGGGYSEITEGYLNPTKFIKKHRNTN